MREDHDVFFLKMAHLVATRGTCLRRRVGAVAVNVRRHVVSTGYNGVPSGFPHCTEGVPCPGATAPSGQDLDLCLATHAEVNLLAQCADVWTIHTVYLTCSPCYSCVKALVTSGCQRLVFTEEYPHPRARDIWLRAEREWVQLIVEPTGRGAFW